MSRPLRIGTRGSRLALWQANHVAGLIQALGTDRPVELVEIQTVGDRVLDQPLGQIGGEGVFTKEIERALLDQAVDLAVHSLKDLPTITVEGLVLGAIPARGSTEDVFVSVRHVRFDQMPAGAVVATGSIRRQAQLRHRRPDLKFVGIRGNVETRLRKLVEDGLDALILARAGLERLELTQAITEVLDPQWMLPAVGQGALGLQCRANDGETRSILQLLNHPPSRQSVYAERALLYALGGGCQVPIGAAAQFEHDRLKLRAAVLDPEGKQRIEDELAGPLDRPEELGQHLAERLLAAGAADLLVS